jgi:hypothetical protein
MRKFVPALSKLGYNRRRTHLQRKIQMHNDHWKERVLEAIKDWISTAERKGHSALIPQPGAPEPLFASCLLAGPDLCAATFPILYHTR